MCLAASPKRREEADHLEKEPFSYLIGCDSHCRTNGGLSENRRDGRRPTRNRAREEEEMRAKVKRPNTTGFIAMLLANMLLPGALGVACGGCSGSKSSKAKEPQLTKRTYHARLQSCREQVEAAHLAEIARWMKEKAETKELADGVDALLVGEATRTVFATASSALYERYFALLDAIPSEEAFGKAVQDGPRKEVPRCFAKKKCSDFAACVSTAVTLPLLAQGGTDKLLLKLVSKPSLQDQMMATPDLPRAIAIARPAMTDEQGKLSQGAALLAMWGAVKSLKVGQVRSLPESSFASVMKDSDEERGRHLCTRGNIIEIRAERTPHGKLYEGGMFMGWGYSNVARFIALGSTRGINQGSRAQFCGVVIGRFSYANSAGGATHAVQLVGLFDIPENR